MENDYIKCGRKTFDLEDGDTVMDNGSCLQLITKKASAGRVAYASPRVSKAEFKRFKSYSKVRLNQGHTYGDGVTLWTYLS